MCTLEVSGHAVDFEHGQLHFVLDGLADGDGDRRSASGRKAQARDVGVARRDRERGCENGRHTGKRFGLVALDKAPRFLMLLGLRQPAGDSTTRQPPAVSVISAFSEPPT